MTEHWVPHGAQHTPVRRRCAQWPSEDRRRVGVRRSARPSVQPGDHPHPSPPPSMGKGCADASLRWPCLAGGWFDRLTTNGKWAAPHSTPFGLSLSKGARYDLRQRWWSQYTPVEGFRPLPSPIDGEGVRLCLLRLSCRGGGGSTGSPRTGKGLHCAPPVRLGYPPAAWRAVASLASRSAMAVARSSSRLARSTTGMSIILPSMANEPRPSASALAFSSTTRRA